MEGCRVSGTTANCRRTGLHGPVRLQFAVVPKKTGGSYGKAHMGMECAGLTDMVVSGGGK